LIKYFIPEDGDDEKHPNVFFLKRAPTQQDLTLREIKKSFPIPGNYHFRFLTNIASYTVWLDVVNDDDTAPSFENGIFCKINRIPNKTFGSDDIRKSQIERHSQEEQTQSRNETSNNNHSKQPQQPPPSRVASSDPSKPIVKPPKPVPSSSQQPQQQSNPPTTTTAASLSASEKLLKFDDDMDEEFTAFSSSPPKPLPAAARSFNAFEDAPQQSSAAPIVSGALLEDDLLGMDSSATVKPSNFHQHVRSFLVCST